MTLPISVASLVAGVVFGVLALWQAKGSADQKTAYVPHVPGPGLKNLPTNHIERPRPRFYPEATAIFVASEHRRSYATQ